MNNNNCNCRPSCITLSIIAAAIIGVIAAFLRLTGTITVTPAFLWVLFGVAIGYLAVTLIATALLGRSGLRDCICSILPVLLAGILGTALTSVVLLGITFAATSIVGAIITGIALFAFSLTVITTACLARCIACDED
ncbi:MAG: hypothetical protein IKT56_06835 [Clostridia bacterium]|nr:hypothetical protein [Clostridia bacterium]